MPPAALHWGTAGADFRPSPLTARRAGMISTVFIQPVDMVKVRIQLGEKGNPVSGCGLFAFG